MNPHESEALLSLNDVADVLGVSLWTAREYVKRDAIPVVRLGSPRGPIRVRQASLNAWIRSHETPARTA
jgi:hypothetical protein